MIGQQQPEHDAANREKREGNDRKSSDDATGELKQPGRIGSNKQQNASGLKLPLLSGSDAHRHQHGLLKGEDAHHSATDQHKGKSAKGMQQETSDVRISQYRSPRREHKQPK